MFGLEEMLNQAENKEYDVLAVGELLIDMISEDYSDLFEGNVYHRYVGGSPSNIALNMERLGGKSIVAAAVGRDGTGDYLTGHLKRCGLDTNLIQRVEQPTSMVMLTKSQGSPIPIFYRGADYYLEYSVKMQRALGNSRILHFSCWPVSKQPAREAIEQMLQDAKRNGMLVGFDPNYHPMIWNKQEDGIQYIQKLIQYVDIIKPSEDDAERLFGKASPEAQIEKFLKLGARLVIMTLGKDGAIVSNGEETMKLATLADTVVDTTGAGDAFWGGFYTSYCQGFSIRKSVQAGMAASAYKLKYTGAVVNLPNLASVKKLYGLE